MFASCGAGSPRKMPKRCSRSSRTAPLGRPMPFTDRGSAALAALRHADQLALAVNLDMAEWWAPTRDSYLAHVSKAQILEAVREGVSEKEADGLAGLKKDP